MTLPAKTLTLLVFVSLGVNALLLLIVIAMGSRRRRSSPRHVVVDDVMRGMLDGQAQSFLRLEQAVRQVAGEQQRLGQLFKTAVQRVGLVRYDAFEDVGGRLSFSCAMLNDEGDGVVMTSINGRQDTRVYAKPVSNGRSTYNLSVEEEEAIRQALAAPEDVVRAR